MDIWNRAREAFAQVLESELSELGIKIVHKSGAWWGVRCPFCHDSGGSGSVSAQSAQLKCHQCGFNQPLFDWYAKHQGLDSPWAACERICSRLNINIPKRTRGKPRVNFDKRELEIAVAELWSSDEAKGFRDELLKRGFTSAMLTPYHIGFRNGHLVFPQVTPEGSLRSRYHFWRGPWAKIGKWGWSSGAEEPQCFWPMHRTPRENDIIFITEGEMDCLVARELLDWAGFSAYTWTGGASSPIKFPAIPSWMQGRKVVMCYDNDVWQGPDLKDYFAPTEKAMRETLQRRRKFLENCEILSRMGCDVHLAQVPVSPVDVFGGDLRDWYMRGGRNVEDLVLTPFAEAKKDQVKPTEMSLGKALESPGEVVRVKGTLDSIEPERIWRPRTIEIDCEKGQHRACESCQVPAKYDKGIIHCSEMQDLQHQILMSKNPQQAIEEQVLGRPRSCPRLRLVVSDEGVLMTKSYFRSTGSEDGIESEILVLSESVPGSESEATIEGKVLHTLDGTGLFLAASSMVMSQAEPIEVKDHVGWLHELCPWDAGHVDQLHAYFKARAQDLAANVTGIRGQELLHIAYDLVAHSGLWMMVDGRKRRAWLDASVVGVTRCGKTEACRSLRSHYGNMGSLVSTQDNHSLAGIISANVRRPNGNYRVQPGLFPRNHRGMITMDEFHVMNATGRRHIMESLQEARDSGWVQSLKAAGNVQMLSAVRLLTLANPIGRHGFRSYRMKAPMVLDLYGTPEAVARLDFCLMIDDRAAELAKRQAVKEVQHRFTSELCHVLLRRAWDMAPEDIIFEDGVLHLVDEINESWGQVLVTDLPLYTGPEKRLSLLRMAVATALVSFAHPLANLKVCPVRKCHVEFAKWTMEQLWDSSDFTRYCNLSPKRKKVIKPERAEWFLTRYFPDPEQFASAFGHLFGSFHRLDLAAILPLEPRDVDKWLAEMVSLQVIELFRNEDGRGSQLSLTYGGSILLQKIIDCAENRPQEYFDRAKIYEDWFTKRGLKPASFTTFGNHDGEDEYDYQVDVGD